MSEKVTIIAVDPGKTVGIAIYHDGNFSALQLPARDAVAFISGAVDGFVEGGHLPTIAVERFTSGTGPRRAVSAQADATDVIGAMYDISVRHLLDLRRSSAADAKAIAPDERLRQLLWFIEAMPHANDGARHLWLTIIRLFPQEMFRILEDARRQRNEAEELKTSATG